MPAFVDLRGHQCGRLTVLDRAPNRGRRVYWHVRCECGEERVVQGDHLRRGQTRSCGCLNVEVATARATTHGLGGTPEYHALWGARRRCINPSDSRFADYGGRGIEYRFPTDYGDATALLIEAIGPRPEGLTLDRIDNEGHYEVGNLRWATRSEQQRNRRPWKSPRPRDPRTGRYTLAALLDVAPEALREPEEART